MWPRSRRGVSAIRGNLCRSYAELRGTKSGARRDLEVMRAAVRYYHREYGLDVMPARARIEQLLEWTMPVAEELGVASFLTVPAATPAERQTARHEAGQSMEEIYAQEVLEAVHV